MTDPAFSSEPEIEGRLSRPRRFLRMLDINRAIGFAVLSRAWQLLTGPMTQLLMVFFFTGDTLDQYQLFLSLIGIQAFFELGLPTVLINAASHEWARLSYDGRTVIGEPEARCRLGSLLRTAGRWSAGSALLMAGGLSLVGLQLLHTSDSSFAASTFCSSAWVLLVLLTSLTLRLMPAIMILEGCGALAVINRVRFAAAVAGTLVVWILISLNLSVWALAGAAACRLAGDMWLVRRTYRGFFESLLRPDSSPDSRSQAVSWQTEIFPLQWRLALQSAVLWMCTGAATTALYSAPPGVATENATGRFGMSWTILSALQLAAAAWIDTNRPDLGAMLASGQISGFRRLYRSSMLRALSIFAAGAACYCAGLWICRLSDAWLLERISARMLVPAEAAVLSAALCCGLVSHGAGIYIRCQKVEPLFIPMIIANSVVALLVWFGARNFGSGGVVCGMFIGIALVQMPWCILVLRRHQA